MKTESTPKWVLFLCRVFGHRWRKDWTKIGVSNGQFVGVECHTCQRCLVRNINGQELDAVKVELKQSAAIGRMFRDMAQGYEGPPDGMGWIDDMKG